MCQTGGESRTRQGRPSVGQISRYAVDIAKGVFQVHGEDAERSTKVQKRLARGKLLAFFAKAAPALVVLEACGTAHYWARELAKLGHEVRLIPPQHVKPFVKRNKNDARDAEAIFEASLRPGTHFVPVKSVEQQAARALHSGRDLLVVQRTALGNHIRSLLAEIGVTAAQGAAGAAALHALIDAEHVSIPAAMLAVLRPLLDQWRSLHQAVEALGDDIEKAARSDPRAKLLMQIDGVGTRHRPRRAGRHRRRPPVRLRPRLRRLGRAHAPTAFERRQDQARPHHQGRRQEAEAAVRPGRQLLGTPRPPQARQGLGLADRPARPPARQGRRRRPGRQDRPHHLGHAHLGRKLSGSRHGVSPGPRPPSVRSKEQARQIGRDLDSPLRHRAFEHAGMIGIQSAIPLQASGHKARINRPDT